jgi:hypothetical protein
MVSVGLFFPEQWLMSQGDEQIITIDEAVPCFFLHVRGDSWPVAVCISQGE